MSGACCFLMDNLRYSIGELAKAADVTPRTIRFYSAEGLLPPAMSEGRYAVYTDAHLVRLQLIQRLKNAFLPLNAIRAYIEGLSDVQITALIGDSSGLPTGKTADNLRAIRVKAAEPAEGQSRLEYLAQILAVTGQGVANDPEAADGDRRKRAILVSPVFQPDADSSTVNVESSPAGTVSSDVWERITINAGMELHVRAPLTTESRQKIEQIVSLAKSLFPGNS